MFIVLIKFLFFIFFYKMETEYIIIAVLIIVVIIVLYFYFTKEEPTHPTCPTCPTCPAPQKDPEIDYALVTMKAFYEKLNELRLNYDCVPKAQVMTPPMDNLIKAQLLTRNDPNYLVFVKKYNLN